MKARPLPSPPIILGLIARVTPAAARATGNGFQCTIDLLSMVSVCCDFQHRAEARARLLMHAQLQFNARAFPPQLRHLRTNGREPLIEGYRPLEITFFYGPNSLIVEKPHQHGTVFHGLPLIRIYWQPNSYRSSHQINQCLRCQLTAAVERIHNYRGTIAPERDNDLAGGIQNIYLPANAPRDCHVQNSQSDGQSATTVDHGDQIGIGAVIISCAVPPKIMLIAQYGSQCRRTLRAVEALLATAASSAVNVSSFVS